MAKSYEFPIVHVNGSSPEDIFRVCKLALEYKAKFKKDFLIDLICKISRLLPSQANYFINIGYRKYGHNEVDEPEFTQPMMYQ